jgi:hypothetical protein
MTRASKFLESDLASPNLENLDMKSRISVLLLRVILLQTMSCFKQCPDNVHFCIGIENKVMSLSREQGCLKNNSCVFAVTAVKQDMYRVKWTLLLAINPYNLTQVNSRGIFYLTDQTNEEQEVIAFQVAGTIEHEINFQATLYPSIETEVTDSLRLEDKEEVYQRELKHRYCSFTSPLILSTNTTIHGQDVFTSLYLDQPLYAVIKVTISGVIWGGKDEKLTIQWNGRSPEKTNPFQDFTSETDPSVERLDSVNTSWNILNMIFIAIGVSGFVSIIAATVIFMRAKEKKRKAQFDLTSISLDNSVMNEDWKSEK